MQHLLPSVSGSQVLILELCTNIQTYLDTKYTSSIYRQIPCVPLLDPDLPSIAHVFHLGTFKLNIYHQFDLVSKFYTQA